MPNENLMRNNIKIIKRLCSIFFPKSFISKDFINLLYLYERLIKHHNYIGAIKYFKNMRLHCTRYICGNPLLINHNGIGLTKDGWPKKLLFLKDRVDNGQLSYVMTLLVFNRSLDLPKQELSKHEEIDTKSITDKSTCKFIIPIGYIRKFVKKNNLKITQEELRFTPRDFYLSVKGGPQGKASLSAHKNLMVMDTKYIQRLKDLSVGDFVPNWLDKSIKFWSPKFETLKLEPHLDTTGKLSIVKDPEGKFRVIAIVDYYTQVLLKKLHQVCFEKIKNFPQDRTFTQNPISEWESNDENYWSLDLSSATDRFPRELQRRLLAEMYDYKYAKAWSDHLGSIKFDKKNGTVSYETGQPMGTYSSWIMFTLAHHLVVHFCAHLEGVPNFNQYIILGDDIVIKHDKIAKRYIKIIKSLGVELSITKTHVSKDTYEFAKRWFKNGFEFTGLPSRGIIHNFNNKTIVFSILYDFYKIKKNRYSSSYSLVDSISKLYNNTYLIKNGRKIIFHLNQKVKSRLIDFNWTLDMNFGYDDQNKLEQLFAKKLISTDNVSIPRTMKSLKMIMAIGLKSSVSSKIKVLEDLKKNFNSLKLGESPNMLENVNIKLNLVWPFFNGIKNEVHNLYADYYINVDKNLSNIYEYVTKVRILDFDSIYNKQRKKYESIFVIGTTLNKGFQEVNKFIEVNKNSPYMANNLDFINILSNANFDMMWNIKKGSFNKGWNEASLAGI